MRENGKLSNILLNCGLPREEYLKVRDEIIESNRINLNVYSRVSAVFFALTAISALTFVPYIQHEVPVLIFAMAAMIIIDILSVTFAVKYKEHVKSICYLYAFVLFGVGIYASSVGNSNERAVTFIAFVLTMPMIFTDIPLRLISAIALTDIIFLVVDYRVKPEEIFKADMINCIMYSTLGCITAIYMILTRIQKYKYKNQVEMLGETDQLTQLKNRHYFEKRRHEYKDMAKEKIGCVYLDANGLHELNNQYGHEAGDKMLQRISEAMSDVFDQSDVYRVGGDEFVVITIDEDDAVIGEKVDKLKVRIGNYGYHAAIGWASDNLTALDLHGLVRIAEEKMYDDKKYFYDQCGKDRRTRA